MSYRIFELDPYLLPYKADIELRMANYARKRRELVGEDGSLKDFANAHEYFGFHKTDKGWFYREWAPGADEVYLTGDMNGWKWLELKLERLENGIFEIFLPGTNALYNGCHVKAIIRRGDDLLERIPLYIRRVEQDIYTHAWSRRRSI